MSEGRDDREKPGVSRGETPDLSKRRRKRANAAPDAVKDPNEKTDGKPGEASGREIDPGGG